MRGKEHWCRSASIVIAAAIGSIVSASGLALAQDNDKQTCLQLSDPDRSIPACTRIIDSKPQNQSELADIYLFRASAYRDKKQTEAALRDLDAALRLNPNLVDAYVVRGTVQLVTNHPDEAIKDLSSALRLNPNHAEAHRQRAAAYTMKRDLPGAIRDLDEIIRLEPRSAAAHYQRGIALGFSGQHERAFADFDTAVKLQPENPLGLTALGQAYVEGVGVAKNPERGVELLRKAARAGFPPAKELLAKLGQPAQ
jgi:tetratricopeptide (TPR) repeat protein